MMRRVGFGIDFPPIDDGDTIARKGGVVKKSGYFKRKPVERIGRM